MRGFRASRAIQNFKSSRFGKQFQPRVIQGGVNSQNPQPEQHGEQQQKRELPAWLRLPPEPKPEPKAERKKVSRPKTARARKQARAKPVVELRKRKKAA